jgi:hypothetical protein
LRAFLLQFAGGKKKIGKKEKGKGKKRTYCGVSFTFPCFACSHCQPWRFVEGALDYKHVRPV